jgi:hypothetical protein
MEAVVVMEAVVMMEAATEPAAMEAPVNRASVRPTRGSRRRQRE